ncbi:MAG: phosphotransferase family protein [Rhodobacteraceae bacterium]|nr:phosphotransferase family protein [Paracoccaceae bacterium]
MKRFLEMAQEVSLEHADVGHIVGKVNSARRLSGLTNLVLQLDADNGIFVVRIPTTTTGKQIDREAEYFNLSCAAKLGVCEMPLYFDTGTGVMLNRAYALIDKRPAPEQLGEIVGCLHQGKKAFKGTLEVRSLLEPYLTSAFARSVPDMPAQSLALADDLARQVEQALQMLHLSFEGSMMVPSHCDLSPGNILMTQGGLRLIDFEYSAMAPAVWDLAYAIQENAMDVVSEEAFVNAYSACGALSPAADDLGAMKLCCDLVSAGWAVQQLSDGNAFGDFTSFARKRLESASRQFATLSARQ